jgi:hypothetical protein
LKIDLKSSSPSPSSRGTTPTSPVKSPSRKPSLDLGEVKQQTRKRSLLDESARADLARDLSLTSDLLYLVTDASLSVTDRTYEVVTLWIEQRITITIILTLVIKKLIYVKEITEVSLLDQLVSSYS